MRTSNDNVSNDGYARGGGMSQRGKVRKRNVGALALTVLALLAPAVHAQEVFSSGSTGADGELRFSSPPGVRENHAMAYDSARNVIVMLGGSTNISFFDPSTYEWNGLGWTRRSFGEAPSARLGQGLAYDEARGVVVLFGGEQAIGGSVGFGEHLNDTWEYDGTAWTQRFPEVSPPVRRFMGMTYDAARRRVVMAGGEARIPPLSRVDLTDAWEWDGETWVEIESIPESFSRFTMAYDRGREVSVLFGGNQSTGRIFEWDGVSWSTADGPAREAPAMAYDEAAERILLFGGRTNLFTHTDDLFAWDGSTLTTLEKGPPARGGAAMAYDRGRRNVVLFGGRGDVERNQLRQLADTWIWDGATWEAPSFAQPFPVIDMAEKPDGIWNYTTIDVQAGVELRFAKNVANTPVVWLATGDVSIGGIVDLDGEDGKIDATPGNEPVGGPAGFNGGLGGLRFDQSGTFAANPGQGPGGGEAGVDSGEAGGAASHATAGVGAGVGPTYGNVFLDPLVGGSGGGGDASTQSRTGASGGAGGGAILIASSRSIRVDGQLHADGGGPFTGIGGGGSGGAIRLAANSVEGQGILRAVGKGGFGGAGRIRIEAFVRDLAQPPNPLAVFAPPLTLRLGERPQIRITGVAGQPVVQPPSGSTVAPDVVFGEAGEIEVALETTNIPEGSVLTVRVTAEGQVITGESTPTDGSGRATASLTVPAGVGTIQGFADFERP